MKHQVPESMKFRKLQRKLGLSKRDTVSTLELLWISAQKNCPQGDIGRFTNEEIAIECEWDGDADTLVEALTEVRWLDPCAVRRLLIHDWPEHAPGWIKRQLKRHGKDFFTPVSPPDVTDDTQEATKRPPSAPRDAQEPTLNLTQPNPKKPKEDASASCPASPNVSEPEKPRKASKRKAYAGEHPGFREWYAAYPRKDAPEAASRAYTKAVQRIQGRDGPGGDDPVAYLLDRAKAYADSGIGRGDKQFIKQPAGWLNDRRFDDDPSCWVRDEARSQRGSPAGPAPNRRGEIPVTDADLAEFFGSHDA